MKVGTVLSYSWMWTFDRSRVLDQDNVCRQSRESVPGANILAELFLDRSKLFDKSLLANTKSSILLFLDFHQINDERPFFYQLRHEREENSVICRIICTVFLPFLRRSWHVSRAKYFPQHAVNMFNNFGNCCGGHVKAVARSICDALVEKLHATARRSSSGTGWRWCPKWRIWDEPGRLTCKHSKNIKVRKTV